MTYSRQQKRLNARLPLVSPAVILFPLFQSRVIRGISSGVSANPGSNLNVRKLRTGKPISQSDAVVGGATLDSSDKGKSPSLNLSSRLTAQLGSLPNINWFGTVFGH